MSLIIFNLRLWLNDNIEVRDILVKQDIICEINDPTSDSETFNKDDDARIEEMELIIIFEEAYKQANCIRIFLQS